MPGEGDITGSTGVAPDFHYVIWNFAEDSARTSLAPSAPSPLRQRAAEACAGGAHNAGTSAVAGSVRIGNGNHGIARYEPGRSACLERPIPPCGIAGVGDLSLRFKCGDRGTRNMGAGCAMRGSPEWRTAHRHRV